MYNFRNNGMRPNRPMPPGNRFIGGGFLGPFLLGGITGGLLAPAFYPRPYYPPMPYPPYQSYQSFQSFQPYPYMY